MANPFKEADKAKKKPAGNIQTPAAKKEEVVAPVKETVQEPKVEKPAKEVKKNEEKPTVTKKKANLLDGLNAVKDSAHTHAFYLTDKNVEKLKAVAEEKGVSASKLLDYILSEFL